MSDRASFALALSAGRTFSRNSLTSLARPAKKNSSCVADTASGRRRKMRSPLGLPTMFPWKFTKKYLTLRQDPSNSEAQKLGLFNPDTWAAYLLRGDAFVKRTKADPSQTYPDFGCSFETFTNNDFLEVETLGPMTKLLPGKT